MTHSSKLILMSSLALSLACPALAPAIAAEQAPPSPKGAAGVSRAVDKPANDRRDALRRQLDALAAQIDEINANIDRLGAHNAAALRFRTISLAAYQRAWAELTRDEVDFGGTGDRQLVTAMTVSRP